MTPRAAILVTHPIQYFTPWFRELEARKEVDFEVLYCFQPDAKQQGTGYGKAFEWDRPLLEGYRHRFLENASKTPGFHFNGCDTPQVKNLISSEAYDAWIICGWNTRSYWQAIRACHRHGVPMAIRGDSHLLGRRPISLRILKRFLHGRWIPRFSAYLTVGKLNEDYYRHYGADENRFFPVRHFVDNEWFAAQSEAARTNREKLRRHWDIPSNAVVFVFCGKLVETKRPKDILLALEQLDREDTHALFVGDGPYRQECEEFAASRNLPVTFAGFLNQGELPEAYAASDVLLLPSRETWGLVVNEAMASGLPAIVSDQTGCAPDLVLPEKTGRVIPHGEINVLASAMNTYRQKPSLAKEQGEAARELVHRRFNPSGAADRTVEAIQAIL